MRSPTMVTTPVDELLQRLKAGAYDPADVKTLESATFDEVLAELAAQYPVRFQERRLKNKREIALARSVHLETAAPAKAAFVTFLLMVPVYRHCIFLSGEGQRITGISVLSRMRARPVRTPFEGLALASGRGFKLDHTPDGWRLKVMARQTVKLSNEFLLKRGWCFDALQQLMPRS